VVGVAGGADKVSLTISVHFIYSTAGKHNFMFSDENVPTQKSPSQCSHVVDAG